MGGGGPLPLLLPRKEKITHSGTVTMTSVRVMSSRWRVYSTLTVMLPPAPSSGQQVSMSGSWLASSSLAA
jgi:hypothetical protein